MPVIDEWYDVSINPGAPALVNFYSAYLGERSAMNKAFIQQRLKEADPRTRMMMAAKIRDNITDLQRTKAEMKEAKLKGDSKLLSDLMNGISRMTSAHLTAQATASSANARMATAQMEMLTAENARMQEDMGAGDASFGAVMNTVKSISDQGSGRTISDPKSQAMAIESGKSEILSTINAMRKQNKVSPGSNQDVWLGVSVIGALSAELDSGNLSSAQEASLRGALAQAQESFFGSKDPSEQIARRYGHTNPAILDILGQGRAGTGGINDGINQLYSIAVAGGGFGGGGGGSGSASLSTLVSTGVPDISDDVKAIDNRIDWLGKQLEDLQNEGRRDKRQDPFRDFSGNYMTETPFRRNPAQPTLDRIGDLPPALQDQLLGKIDEYGSPSAALQALQAGEWGWDQPKSLAETIGEQNKEILKKKVEGRALANIQSGGGERVQPGTPAAGISNSVRNARAPIDQRLQDEEDQSKAKEIADAIETTGELPDPDLPNSGGERPGDEWQRPEPGETEVEEPRLGESFQLSVDEEDKIKRAILDLYSQAEASTDEAEREQLRDQIAYLISRAEGRNHSEGRGAIAEEMRRGSAGVGSFLGDLREDVAAALAGGEGASDLMRKVARRYSKPYNEALSPAMDLAATEFAPTLPAQAGYALGRSLGHRADPVDEYARALQDDPDLIEAVSLAEPYY